MPDLLLVVHVPDADPDEEESAEDMASRLALALNRHEDRTGDRQAIVSLWPTPQWVTWEQISWLMRAAKQTHKAMNLARYCVKALKMADLYLDGFVWTTEPEASELRRIQRASKKAQAQLAALPPVKAAPRRAAPEGTPGNG